MKSGPESSRGPSPERDPGSNPGSTGRVVALVALYVGVRLVLVAMLAGVMSLLGLPVLLSLLIAIVLALPLSLVAFRSLRARMNTEIEAATRVRRERRERLRAELRGDSEG